MSPGNIAPVAYLKLTQLHLEKKPSVSQLVCVCMCVQVPFCVHLLICMLTLPVACGAVPPYKFSVRA